VQRRQLLPAEYNPAMGRLTFAMNLTLDGCCDHTAGIADDELHDHFTGLMDEAGAMLWGRTTYEMMEGAWPAIARDEQAPRAMREWALKLDAKPKYVVSSTRRDYAWENTIHLQGDLREGVQRIKDGTPAGILLGSLALGAELQRLDLIDEYRLVFHPILAGRGPRLFDGLPASRQLERVSVKTFRGGHVALHFRRRASG
jgi:dihydrofolate reductase